MTVKLVNSEQVCNRDPVTTVEGITVFNTEVRPKVP